MATTTVVAKAICLTRVVIAAGVTAMIAAPIKGRSMMIVSVSFIIVLPPKSL